MEENVIWDIVNDYIENEIDYIRRKEDCTSLSKEDIRDLYMLENISNPDKWELVYSILNDTELNNVLNETIHYYLYHREVK